MYNVGTMEGRRGRGYGRAITVAALLEGRRAGMRIGVLQATEMGEPPYRAMGFQAYGRRLWAARTEGGQARP